MKTRDRGHSSKPYPNVQELYRASLPSYAKAGGFLIEEESVDRPCSSRIRRREPEFEPLPETDTDLICLECSTKLSTAFLYSTFGHCVCDGCRIGKDKYKLLTRTEAKSQYLLKDCDLDSRKPALRYLNKKNPRSPRFGDMKLYLRAQVEERAIAVWGSREALEEARFRRKRNNETNKQNRYNKKLIELRKQVRSELYVKAPKVHVHDFEEETYNEGNDVYFKKCKLCPFKMEYEKM
uniref:XPA C-terminal domain-containing protein n=1 Tax=Trichuris muris TaxID=70415 RepID=A0A5S6Q3L2_TRIMR